MRSADVAKVLRGASIVIDSMVVNNKPLLLEKFSRLQYHACELVQVALEIRQEMSTSNNRTDHQTTGDAPFSSSATKKSVVDVVQESLTDDDASEKVNAETFKTPIKSAKMREQKVPSTQLERLWGFGSLAARLAVGAVSEKVFGEPPAGDSPRRGKLSDAGAEQLAETLCRMRGAALKLGQMLSLQDEDVLPPALSKALDRVRHSADYMPKHQLHSQICRQLGMDWRKHFESFDDIPIAAASIGQVHRGTLLDGREVAMKIQYPGVANSIHSDLKNLKGLITMANILPPGLFIEQIIKVAGAELAMECDYELEASHQMRYKALVEKDPFLRKYAHVPAVIPELSSKEVLTSEFVPGIPVDRAELPQKLRNGIAGVVLVTTMRELFEWRFLQSDPNFSNFLYDGPSHKINFVDFGASREYRKKFVDDYLRLVWAAANRDEASLLQVSKELGFLSNDESKEMLAAHVAAGMVLGEPFRSNEPFDFGNSALTTRMSSFGDVFMKHRVTPPPPETYSLHRKLAGAFLLCIRLKAVIPCRDILETTYQNYRFGDT